MNQQQYKEFYKFASILDNNLILLFHDVNQRPDPCKGDKYLLIHQYALQEQIFINEALVFDCVEFDANFKYGVAFYYVFDNQYGQKSKVWSINDITDIEGFRKDSKYEEMLPFVYGFWRNLIPYHLKIKNYESISTIA